MASRLSEKTLKDVSRVAKCFQELTFFQVNIIKNKWMLSVRLKEKLKELFDKSGNTLKRRLKLHRLLKLVVLLISKTWALSELQERLAVLKRKPAAENQTKAYQRQTVLDLNTKETSAVQMLANITFSPAKVDEDKFSQRTESLNKTQPNFIIKSVSDSRPENKDLVNTEIVYNKTTNYSLTQPSVVFNPNMCDTTHELQTGSDLLFMNSDTSTNVGGNYTKKMEYISDDVTLYEETLNSNSANFETNVLSTMGAFSCPLTNNDIETAFAVASISSMDSNPNSARTCVGENSVVKSCIHSKHKKTALTGTNKVDSIQELDNLLNNKVKDTKKRLRQKPERFLDNTDPSNVKLRKKRPYKKRSMPTGDSISFHLSKHQKCDDSRRTIKPSNEVLVFVPTNYSSCKAIDYTTQLIPSSKFKLINQKKPVEIEKTIVQLLDERDNSANVVAKKKLYAKYNRVTPGVQSSITQFLDKKDNTQNGLAEKKCYVVFGKNNNAVRSPIKQHLKSLAGNCIVESSEGGAKYEIFQSV